jgi:hypothetical protein
MNIPNIPNGRFFYVRRDPGDRPPDKVPAKPGQTGTIWSVFASGFRPKERRYRIVTL